MFLNSNQKRFLMVDALFSFMLLLLFVPVLLSCGGGDFIATLGEETVFVLDAGHGGEDCGAIGSNGKYEKDLNFEITMELGRQLTDMGYAVVYTRTEDRLLYTEEQNIKGLRKIYDLKNRVKITNFYSNAVFISLHMNSFSDPKYSGLQVFYSENNEKSSALATSIQNQVKEKIQPKNNRNIRSGKGLYLMDHLECVAILIECGFISNPEECQNLCEKEYQKQLCFSILCGIMDVNTKS